MERVLLPRRASSPEGTLRLNWPSPQHSVRQRRPMHLVLNVHRNKVVFKTFKALIPFSSNIGTLKCQIVEPTVSSSCWQTETKNGCRMMACKFILSTRSVANLNKLNFKICCLKSAEIHQSGNAIRDKLLRMVGVYRFTSGLHFNHQMVSYQFLIDMAKVATFHIVYRLGMNSFMVSLSDRH